VWHVPRCACIHIYLFWGRHRGVEIYTSSLHLAETQISGIYFISWCVRERLLSSRARRLSAGGFCAKLLFQHQRIHVHSRRIYVCGSGLWFRINFDVHLPEWHFKTAISKIAIPHKLIGNNITIWPPKLALRWNKIALNSDDLYVKSEWPLLHGILPYLMTLKFAWHCNLPE